LPALAGSAFLYKPDAKQRYRLGFSSVAFLYCSSVQSASDWHCDD
jgi:hypothetical protein